jgi:fructan beta-fructosidase
MHWQHETISPGTNLLSDVNGQALEIIAEFQEYTSTERFGFRVRVGAEEFTTIGFHTRQTKLFVDRSHSGQNDFYAGFAAAQVADLLPVNGVVRLHIFVDRASVEVFGNDGQVVFSDNIFPSEYSQGLELFTEGGPVTLNSLDVYQLNAARFLISNDPGTPRNAFR